MRDLHPAYPTILYIGTEPYARARVAIPALIP